MKIPALSAYSKVQTRIAHKNDFTIKANEESSYSFRKYLQTSDIDLHDYADGTIEKTTIGDVDYIRTTDNFDRIYYIYRHEPSGVTYKVIISGEENDSVRTFLTIWN